jgi:uncharacterized membrane protein YbhN (UPF0104 family)
MAGKPLSQSDSNPSSSPTPSQVQPSRVVSRLGESAKVTAILAIMLFAFWMVKKKLATGGVTYEKVVESIGSLPWYHFAIALALTVLNYIVLTGYDWIAVRHLRKKLAISKIMAGAVVGYACGNVLGWLLGGNAVRGLFLLAGIAFVALPIHLPEDIMEMLVLKPKTWGYLFLSCVTGYLLSCILIRRPIRFREFEVSLPPFKLSVMQLVVSAGDFLLATTVLYSLMPPEVIGPDKINFSTVLIAYLSAQIAAVVSHVPGGFGILESILLSFLPSEANTEVFTAVILFRAIYYFLPFLVAGLIFLYNEIRVGKRPAEMLHGK